MRKLIGGICVVALGVFCGFQIYHQTGMVHATQKNGYGCICHSFDPSTSVSVWISGPDSLRAGTSADYTVNVARTGNIGAGFNVASYFGDLQITDSIGTQLMRESTTDSLELTHTFTKLRSTNDTISWSFKFRAPLTAGIVDTLYAAGNAVNNDTLPDGDFWNFSPKFIVRILQPTSVHEPVVVSGYKLSQNYPNPFNPSTQIRFEIPSGSHVSLRVLDIAGREVATLVEGYKPAGVHEIMLEAANLSSGIYFYQLTTGTFQSTRKMILAR